VTISHQKVYLDIVEQIRTIIDEDNLQPGDKMPSERELSARLEVGRSSVREALRALELVGLIETKRGEGTFLKDFRGNHLIHLLGTFILQRKEAKDDLIATKMLIEREAIKQACHSRKEETLAEMKGIIEKKTGEKPPIDFYSLFFSKIVESTNNFLLYRIWDIINEYFYSLRLEIDEEKSRKTMQDLYSAIEQQKEQMALQVYEDILELFHIEG
jgi:DNA-binding FadR family transcriptional regulator